MLVYSMNKFKKLRESISITIPAFNEVETIETVYEQALKSVRALTDDYEIVLVDDGSTDGTSRVMDVLKRENPKQTVVVHHKTNKGFSGAMKSCYLNASKDLIFLGPADGQFDYSEVHLFTDAIKNKDMIVAYRVVNKEKWYRKINSFVYHLMAKSLFDIKLRELSSCIMYRRSVRDSIEIAADPFSCLFLSELIYKAIHKGYRIGQVPIHFYPRQGGVQKGTNIRMMLKTIDEMMRFWFSIKRGDVTV